MKTVNNREQVCAVCKETGPTQIHHISYDPEIIIDVCVPCHIKIHQHGVGIISTTQKTLDKAIEKEHEPILPIYTKQDEKNFIVSRNDEAILFLLTCPNCGSKGPSWQILMHPDTHQIFVRCPHCGVDYKAQVFLREKDE